MLIQEAREGISRLEERIEAFLRSEKRSGGVERDPKTGDQLLYIQFESDIPPKISLDVRAVTRDLRDALDHAVYASAVAVSGGEPKRTKFLAADTPEGIQGDIRRGRCNDVHPDIVGFMEREGAHQAGNRTIWALNQFRNDNTHKAVTLSAIESSGFGIGNGSGSFKMISTMSEWRSTIRRLYFARCSADSKFNFQIDPMVEIRMHKSLRLSQEAAVPALGKIADEVKRIVMAIEAETVRILTERAA